MTGFQEKSEVSFERSSVAALAAALAMLAAQAGVAEESGSYRSLRSYHNDYLTIDHGAQTFTGGTLQGTRTIIESSGGPFVAGANSSSDCLVYSRSSDSGISLEAPCTETDLSGDVGYSRAVRSDGDVAVGGGGAGRWELLGGSGKYEGITGSCSYTTEYLEGARAVIVADCTWSRS
jgi:hypothetical protein